MQQIFSDSSTQVNVLNPNFHNSPPTLITATEKADRKTNENEQELQVSVLPLQSLKLSPQQRQKKLSMQEKYLHISKSKSPRSPNNSRINNAKNIIFRPSPNKMVSEQKARNRFEETKMFERQRRFSKQDIQKKVQRLVSPHLIKDQQLKKFARTQQKRLLAEKKKFKRIKQKPNEHEIAVREKLFKKLQDPKHFFLSGIAQQSEAVSQIELTESKGVSFIPQTNSEIIEELPSSFQNT